MSYRFKATRYQILEMAANAVNACEVFGDRLKIENRRLSGKDLPMTLFSDFIKEGSELVGKARFRLNKIGDREPARLLITEAETVPTTLGEEWWYLEDPKEGDQGWFHVYSTAQELVESVLIPEEPEAKSSFLEALDEIGD